MKATRCGTRATSIISKPKQLGQQDPTVYDWAETDFSLYSGAHIGILGALVEETNVESILRLNLQATQFFNEHTLPSYLLYNPFDEAKVVEYVVTSDEPVDLYNSITNERIFSDVSDNADIEIDRMQLS
ncbi:hypothetical protein ACO1PF_10410 [Alkalibacterium sp. f15]|uniref:hypothetical protein n=1 Tax=Alkalibacterium sp. f15 TaxID=3414029 RepID=UPI003BF79F40